MRCPCSMRAAAASVLVDSSRGYQPAQSLRIRGTSPRASVLGRSRSILEKDLARNGWPPLAPADSRDHRVLRHRRIDRRPVPRQPAPRPGRTRTWPRPARESRAKIIQCLTGWLRHNPSPDNFRETHRPRSVSSNLSAQLNLLTRSARPDKSGAVSAPRFTVGHPVRPYDEAAFPHCMPQRRTEDFTWR